MLYVAYGSNMNIEQMLFRCPKSKRIGVSILHDYQLVFDYHLDIRESKGDSVPVVLWDIADSDWASLDRYEGYPNYYIKKIVKVEWNGKIEKAIVYVMNGCCAMQMPSVSYWNIVKTGYLENGIDIATLYEAIERVKKYEKENQKL